MAIPDNDPTGPGVLDDLFGDGKKFLAAVAKWAAIAGVDVFDLYSILVQEAKGVDSALGPADALLEEYATVGTLNDTHGPSNLGFFEFDQAVTRGNLGSLIPKGETRKEAWGRLSRVEYLELAVAATAFNLQQRTEDAKRFISKSKSGWTASDYAVAMYRTGLPDMEEYVKKHGKSNPLGEAYLFAVRSLRVWAFQSFCRKGSGFTCSTQAVK